MHIMAVRDNILSEAAQATLDKRPIYRPHFDYRVREAVPIRYKNILKIYNLDRDSQDVYY